MRVALLFLVAFVAVATADVSVSEQKAQYEFYLAKHSKLYDAEEFALRFDIWRANKDAVEAHNAAGHSFTLAMNQFGDWTNEEYRTWLKRSGLRRSGAASVAGTYQPGDNTNLPAEVDWRTKGVVTPVKNQGQCGSCWAFSAVGAMEGAHALSTGKLLSLSEQELVDCVNGGADTCDLGGEMHDGYLYAIKAGGMQLESTYPYTATSGKGCKFDRTKAVATFSSYLNVTQGNETALQSAMVDRPTISIAIDASKFSFQLYSSGVYDEPKCLNESDQLDHGVLAVGYGTDSASGKDYWLVKNSWGGLWGKAGYIWMRRNANNQCGVASDATFPLV